VATGAVVLVHPFLFPLFPQDKAVVFLLESPVVSVRVGLCLWFLSFRTGAEKSLPLRFWVLTPPFSFSPSFVSGGVSGQWSFFYNGIRYKFSFPWITRISAKGCFGRVGSRAGVYGGQARPRFLARLVVVNGGV